MLEGDAVVEHLDKVGGDLDAGHVDDDGVGGVSGLGGARVVEGDNPEPVHDAVEDVAERALGFVALDEGDLDPRARLNVQHLHAVS